MSIAHPTSPGRRWLEQGQTLTKLKQEYRGNWLLHYNETLRHQFKFSPRSEQLCRHLYGLYIDAVENGERKTADRVLATETRVNELVNKLKELKAKRDHAKRWAWLQSAKAKFSA